jgi:DNA-binding LacI/PurR family transcriptional regulator
MKRFKMKRTRLKEVAKKAGVSLSTASLALNGKPGVHPETRAKVLQVARELEYQPNAAARSLANGRSQAIGLVNPISLEQLFSSADFFMHLSRGLYQAAKEHNYHVFLLVSETDQDAAELVKEVISQRRVDGLIITNPSEAASYLGELERYKFPCVFVGRPSNSQPLYVDNNNIEIGRLGTKHLLSLGCQNIAFLTGPLRFTHCQDRLLGYKLALEEVGFNFREELVWQAEQSEERILAVVKEKITQVQFDAVFATSGLHAVCAIRVCQEYGLRIPNDVAVVCVEDSSLTKYFYPSITAIELDSFWLGYWATKLLLRVIRGEDPGSPILLPGRLVVRASSATRKGGDVTEKNARFAVKT